MDTTSTSNTDRLAFAYLRVSGAGQIDGHGFDRQRQAVADFAAKSGLDIAAEYRDEAVSGTTEWDARDGFAAMVEACEAQGVRTILVENPDRLARDLPVQEAVLASLRKRGIRLVTAAGIDLTDSADPMRVLVRQLLGAVAQYDKSQIVRKLAAARAAKRASGQRCEGRKPYGAVEGEERGIVRIRHLRTIKTYSLRRIAYTLNTEGVPTRSGKPWSAEAVRKVAARCR
jgi:DNA invertase Pin-like site-specific DNA recombinase